MNRQRSKWQVRCPHQSSFSLACCRLFLLSFLFIEIIRALTLLYLSFIPTPPMAFSSTLYNEKDVDSFVTARASLFIDSVPFSSLSASSSSLSSLSLFSASSTSSLPLLFLGRTFLFPFAEAVSQSKAIILTYSFSTMDTMEMSCFVYTRGDTYPTDTADNTAESFKNGSEAWQLDTVQGFSTSYNALLKEPNQPCILQPYLNQFYVFPIYSFGIANGGNISVTVTDTNIQEYAYMDFLSNFMPSTSSEGTQSRSENSTDVPGPDTFSSSPNPPPNLTIPSPPSSTRQDLSSSPSSSNLVSDTTGGTTNEGGSGSSGDSGRASIRDYLPKIRVYPANDTDKVLLLASSRSFRQFRAPLLESYVPPSNKSNTTTSSSIIPTEASTSSSSSSSTSPTLPTYLQPNLFYPLMNLANQCTSDYTLAESSVLLKIFSQTTWNALFSSRSSTKNDGSSSGGPFSSWASLGRQSIPVMSLCNAPSLYTIPLVGPSFIDVDTVIQYDYYLERLVLVVIQCSPIPVQFNLQIILQNVDGQGSSVAYTYYTVLFACVVYYLALILLCVVLVVYRRQQFLLGRHYILQMQWMVEEETQMQKGRLKALDSEGEEVAHINRTAKPSDPSYYDDETNIATTTSSSTTSSSTNSSSSSDKRRRRRNKKDNVRRGSSVFSDVGSATLHSPNSPSFTHASRSPLSRKGVADGSDLGLSMEESRERSVKGKRDNSRFAFSPPPRFSSSPSSWGRDQPTSSSRKDEKKKKREAGVQAKKGRKGSPSPRWNNAKNSHKTRDEEPLNESDTEEEGEGLIDEEMEEEEEMMMRGSRKRWDTPTRRKKNEKINRVRRGTESDDFSLHPSSRSSRPSDLKERNVVDPSRVSSFHTSRGQGPSSSGFSSMQMKHGRTHYYSTGTTTTAFTNTNPNSWKFFFRYCLMSMKESLLFNRKKEIGFSLMAIPQIKRYMYHPLRWVLFILLPLKVLSLLLSFLMYGLMSSGAASNATLTFLSFLFRAIEDEGVMGLQLLMAMGWGLAVENVSSIRTSLICVLLILNILLLGASFSCNEVNVFVWTSLPPDIPTRCATIPVGTFFFNIFIWAICIIELHALHTRITHRAWTNREYPMFIQKPNKLSTISSSRSSSAAVSTASSPSFVSPSLLFSSSSSSSFASSRSHRRRPVSESTRNLQKEKSKVINQRMRRFYYLNETPIPSPSSLYNQKSQNKQNMAHVEEDSDHMTIREHFKDAFVSNWVTTLRLPPFPACPPLSSLWPETKRKDGGMEKRWRRKRWEKRQRSYSRQQYEEEEEEEGHGRGDERSKLTSQEKKQKMEERVCEAHQLILSQATKAYRLALSHHWQSLRVIYHTAYWVYIFVLFWPIVFLVCSLYLYDTGDYYMIFLFEELQSIHILTFAVYFLAC